MTEAEKRKVLEAFNDYIGREYNENPWDELPEDGILPIAYTTYEFDDDYKYTHEIQVNFNLNDMSWYNYIDDELVLVQPCDVESLISSFSADFDSMIRDCVDKGFDLEENGYFDYWKKSIGGTYGR